MHVFFADDAKQNQPSRVRMGALVASGGLFVDGDRLANFERALNNACNSAGFPPNAEFKWSPRRDMWMHQNLVAAERQAFFISIIECCVDHQARALVIISDCESRTPSDCASHEVFVTKMLVERVNNLAVSTNSTAIIIADRPGGGIAQERKFLADTLSTIQTGTRYVKPAQIAINGMSRSS